MKDRAARECVTRRGDDRAYRTSPGRALIAKCTARFASNASLAVFVTLVACGSGRGSSFGGDDNSGGRGAVSSDAGDDGASDTFGSPGVGGTSGSFRTADGGNGGGGDAAAPPTQFIDACTTGAASGLSAQSMKALFAGGSHGSLRYLYPYDGTVFPRGLISPTLMWDGATATYVYVHIKSNLFEYKGCLAPTAAGQVQIPQQVWESAGTFARGASDPFSVSLTVLSGATPMGPITETIVIAPATLKGSIYYNSYSSKLTGQSAATGGSGAVLRIAPGGNAQAFLGQAECTGCHAVAANGTRMVAQPVGASVLGAAGATYSLTSGSVNPTPLVANAPNASFAGVYPDGSLYLACGHPSAAVGPRSTSIGSTNNAGLYETNTGNAVMGTNIPTTSMMGMFSPDGKLLTFNDYAIANGHGLATMTFDVGSRQATGYKTVYQNSSSYPGWPFFLPDDKAIVFVLGDQADFSGNGLGLNVGGLAGSFGTASGDLYINDLASNTTTMLAKAMGFASTQDIASNTTYLPFSASDELHHNFDPTVSPVAAGGYFWAFFDSYRHYGNVGLERQLWGTAIDVSPAGTYTVDPSHPAFYLTGQESGTGNHRAFTALDPCRADGASCMTGVDCCKGLCTNGTCGGPPRCSNLDEMCMTANDCCNADAQCINGFCELPVAR
jgi:hypothetical protein